MKPTDEQLNEMWNWYQQRKVQQLSYPVDDASRNAIRAIGIAGAGSHTLTQSKSISVVPATITVPAAYTGTIVIEAEGAQYEIPYL